MLVCLHEIIGTVIQIDFVLFIVSNVSKRTPASPMKGKKSLVVEAKHRKPHTCTINQLYNVHLVLVGSTNISPSPTANSLGSGNDY